MSTQLHPSTPFTYKMKKEERARQAIVDFLFYGLVGRIGLTDFGFALYCY